MKTRSVSILSRLALVLMICVLSAPCGANAEQGASNQQVVGSASTSASEIPTGRSSVAAMLQGLAATLGVFCVGVYVAQRLRRGRGIVGHKQLRIIERLAVTQKTQLVYLQVNGEPMLISVGSDRVTCLQSPKSRTEAKLFEASLEDACSDSENSYSSSLLS